jgi:hypothetical protein
MEGISQTEHQMGRFISLAVILSLWPVAAMAMDPPPHYAAPPPTGDSKSTIISGVLMIVNGFIMSEADRRHQACATFVTGLDRNGFPLFREVCRTPLRTQQD